MLHRFCLLLGLLVFVSGCNGPKAAVVPPAKPPEAPAVDTVTANFEAAFSTQLQSLHDTEMSAVKAQTDLIVEIRDTLNKVAARIPDESVVPLPSEPSVDKIFEDTPDPPEEPKPVEEPAKTPTTEVVKTADTFEGLDDVEVKDTKSKVIAMEDFANYAKKRIAALREDMAAIEKELAGETPVKTTGSSTWPANLRLVYFYGDPCRYCEVQSPVIDELEAAGVPVRRICAWMPNPNDPEKTLMTEESKEFKVGTAPQVWICDDDSTLHKFDGFVLAADIFEMAEKLAAAPVQTTAVKAAESTTEEWQLVPETWPATIPVDGTLYPSHAGMVRHLRGHSRGGQNHVNDYYQVYPLEIMTVGQLVTLHESDHSNTVSSRVVTSPVYSTQPVFYSQPGPIQQFFRSTTRRGCRGANCP